VVALEEEKMYHRMILTALFWLLVMGLMLLPLKTYKVKLKNPPFTHKIVKITETAQGTQTEMVEEVYYP
jgi:hypothetical protein